MTALLDRVFLARPFALFREHPRFYLYYDLSWFGLCALGLGLLGLLGIAPLFGSPTLAWVPGFVLAAYLLTLGHVFVHNATHSNFHPAINRVVGELCGAAIVTRFASWEVVHMRHHRYSDHREKDPHPNFPSFWKTVVRTITSVEHQLQQQYYDIYGDTPANRRYEKWRARVSYASNLALLALWWRLLGSQAFWLVFVPANLLAGLFIIHFNWSTHNGGRTADLAAFAPVNLNHGYYRWGNLLFFGIYMHGNHHRRTRLFNPARWPEKYGAPLPIVDGPQPAQPQPAQARREEAA